MLSYKKLFVLAVLSSVCCVSAFSQSEVVILPVHNPSHLKVKVMSNDKCLSHSNTISSDDKSITFEAFSFGIDAGNELVIKEILVDLVRGGRLLTREKMNEDGDLSSLFQLAQGNDIFRFSVNGVYIRNEEEKLELYSMGEVNLLFTYVEELNIVMH